jgi:hypothetical protein
MKTDWLRSIVGQRIWSARCQKRIDSSAFRVELNFANINTTIFLNSETPIKANVVKTATPKVELGWSDEKYIVFKENEDNELIIETFHKLWTAAAGTDKYNKADWKRLSAVLYKAGYSV